MPMFASINTPLRLISFSCVALKKPVPVCAAIMLFRREVPFAPQLDDVTTVELPDDGVFTLKESEIEPHESFVGSILQRIATE